MRSDLSLKASGALTPHLAFKVINIASLLIVAAGGCQFRPGGFFLSYEPLSVVLETKKKALRLFECKYFVLCIYPFAAIK